MPFPSDYYVMAAENPERMLLYSISSLPNDIHSNWLSGNLFTKEPRSPIRIEIQAGFESKQLLPFFDHPLVVNEQMLQVLLNAGVDNLVAYEAEIHSDNNSIVHTGYKAINLIGKVRVAGPSTAFSANSRLIDASFDSLEIDNSFTNGLLMFRLAENVSAIIAHARVREAIEAAAFHSVVFRDPSEFLIP